MKLNAYLELNRIWDTITRDQEITNELFDIDVYKSMLDIFQVGNYFYFLLNVRKSKFEFVSPEIVKVLGYPIENIDVAFFVNLMHPEDLPVFLNFEAAVENFFNSLDVNKYFKYKVQYDFRLKHANGQYIRVMHQMVIVKHDAQDIKTFVVYTDISNFKKESRPILSFVGMEGELSYINVDVLNIFTPTKNVFTKREREVVKALSAGLSSFEIGELLNISKLTVDAHRKNILRKTEAKSTNEIIQKAFNNGWV